MRKRLFAALSAAALMCAGTSWAQEDAGEGRKWIPVETFACTFNDGKSMADLMAVVDEWNAWMDEQAVDNYFASVVTPQYFGEYKMDVGWLGAWKDGHAMGADTEIWINEGGEMSAKFFEVISCTSHTNFASTMLKPPVSDDDNTDNTFVLEFSNCSVNSSKTYEEVMAALGAWTDYQTENGFANSMYLMAPVYGESNNDYSFKLIEGRDDYIAFGADFELMGNGGHWMKQRELLDGVIDCDSPRVYNATSVREWADDEAE